MTTLRFTLAGSRDPGAQTVVLSAGLGGAAAFWSPQMEALGRRYRVLTYDHRGTGDNSGPLPDGYAIDDMAAEVVAMLDDAAVDRAHVVGHALGGLVALALALRVPERLRSIALVNAWATLDGVTRRCFEARLALLAGGGPAAYVRAQPIFLYPAAWLATHAERVARDDAHGIATFQGEQTLRRRIAALMGFDAGPQLGTVAMPAWVAAARDDVLVPFLCSEALAAQLGEARLWLAPSGGHAVTVTEPASFNAALLDFLASVPSG